MVETSPIDTLHLGIALGPLAVYLVAVGWINISRKPLITTGARDLAALGLALSGSVFVGPMALFLPEGAANRFGPFVWGFLIALYVLALTLVVLLARARIIVYNVTSEQLRPVLAEVTARLDPESRWAGNCVVLPTLGIQFQVERTSPLRIGQLIAVGAHQNHEGWKQLEDALAEALHERSGVVNPYGYALVAAGLVTLIVLSIQVIYDRQQVVQSLHEMLRW